MNSCLNEVSLNSFSHWAMAIASRNIANDHRPVYLKVMTMKKILNKIGQVLQVVLMAPVKLPDKAGRVLKYMALGLGILQTVLEDKPPVQETDKNSPEDEATAIERSEADEIK